MDIVALDTAWPVQAQVYAPIICERGLERRAYIHDVAPARIVAEAPEHAVPHSLAYSVRLDYRGRYIYAVELGLLLSARPAPDGRRRLLRAMRASDITPLLVRHRQHGYHFWLDNMPPLHVHGPGPPPVPAQPAQPPAAPAPTAAPPTPFVDYAAAVAADVARAVRDNLTNVSTVDKSVALSSFRAEYRARLERMVDDGADLETTIQAASALLDGVMSLTADTPLVLNVSALREDVRAIPAASDRGRIGLQRVRAGARVSLEDAWRHARTALAQASHVQAQVATLAAAVRSTLQPLPRQAVLTAGRPSLGLPPPPDAPVQLPSMPASSAASDPAQARMRRIPAQLRNLYVGGRAWKPCFRWLHQQNQAQQCPNPVCVFAPCSAEFRALPASLQTEFCEQVERNAQAAHF